MSIDTSVHHVPTTDLSDRAFRDLIGMFASGVTVITTTVNGEDYGTTVSAVSSVSADPPTVLTCLNKSSNTRAAVTASSVFVVNVLAAGQESLATAFAVKGGSKFEGVDVARTPNGQVYLPGALAYLTCHVVESISAATHDVFIGEVVTMGRGRGQRPLAYYRGKFGGFHRTHSLSTLVGRNDDIEVDLW